MRGQEPGSEHDRREADRSAAPATPPPSFGQTNGRDVPAAFTPSDVPFDTPSDETADADARPVPPVLRGPSSDLEASPGAQPWEVPGDDATQYDWFSDPAHPDHAHPDHGPSGVPQSGPHAFGHHSEEHPPPGPTHPASGHEHPSPGPTHPAPEHEHPAPGPTHPAPEHEHPAPGPTHPAPGRQHPALRHEHTALGQDYPPFGQPSSDQHAFARQHPSWEPPADPSPFGPPPGDQHAFNPQHPTQDPGHPPFNAQPGQEPAPGQPPFAPQPGQEPPADQGFRPPAYQEPFAAPPTGFTPFGTPAPDHPWQAGDDQTRPGRLQDIRPWDQPHDDQARDTNRWPTDPVVPGAPPWEPPPAFTAAAAGMPAWPAPLDPHAIPPWPAATGELEAEPDEPNLLPPFDPNATNPEGFPRPAHYFDPEAAKRDAAQHPSQGTPAPTEQDATNPAGPHPFHPATDPSPEDATTPPDGIHPLPTPQDAPGTAHHADAPGPSHYLDTPGASDATGSPHYSDAPGASNAPGPSRHPDAPGASNAPGPSRHPDAPGASNAPDHSPHPGTPATPHPPPAEKIAHGSASHGNAAHGNADETTQATPHEGHPDDLQPDDTRLGLPLPGAHSTPLSAPVPATEEHPRPPEPGDVPVWPPTPPTGDKLPELPFSRDTWGHRPSTSLDVARPQAGAPVFPPGAFKQPPFQTPPPPPPPAKSKRALLVTLGALALAGVATGGFFAFQAVSGAPPTTAATRVGASPSITTEQSSPPEAAGTSILNSEQTDPQKLSLSEAFPKKKVSAAGTTFTRVKAHMETTCEKAATGAFADALKEQKCSRVLRATYVDSKRRYAVTTGIAVLPDKTAAATADQVKNLSRNVWFRPLPGPDDSGGERVHIAGGYAAGLVWGRYIVFSYATHADGHTPEAKDKTLPKVSGAFRDQTSLVLERRITKG
ncbi:hypothetical protein GCM10009850_109070 [Nonomuraea monospora]|uniref:Uncharacterized protein n=1 Tax=Nonomuraea monospora TaxID=568818 RepID=A0ABP5PV18_9ACTN